MTTMNKKRIRASMCVWSLHEWNIPARNGTYRKDAKGRWRLNKMFKEMPTNDTFQLEILASSVWGPPIRATDDCPGYEVKAAQKVILPVGRVTNVNLGMSFAPPCGTSIVILPATGSLASKWSLYGKALKSNGAGEALVAVKNSSIEVVYRSR